MRFFITVIIACKPFAQATIIKNMTTVPGMFRTPVFRNDRMQIITGIPIQIVKEVPVNPNHVFFSLNTLLMVLLIHLFVLNA